jgi:opacity protein-like surface antigen
MKSRMAFVFCIVVVAFFAAPALAAGPYVGAQAGAVFLSDASFSGVGGSGDIKFDTGYGAGVFGGFDYGTWRLEGEFTYRVNDNKEISGGGPVGGDMSSMALMLNAYYDFKMVSPVFVPYIGAGVGGARVAAEVSDSLGTFIDDNDMVFAYQVAAGIGFVVNKQLTLDLGYKYFATADPSFEVAGGGSIDGEYKSHNVFLGARFNF